jgi:hypothetical protein
VGKSVRKNTSRGARISKVESEKMVAGAILGDPRFNTGLTVDGRVAVITLFLLMRLGIIPSKESPR